MTVHIVQKGDTLWKIAKEHNVSFEQLKKMNAHLANPEYIVPGMKVNVPDEKEKSGANPPISLDESKRKKAEVPKEEAAPTQEKKKVPPLPELPQAPSGKMNKQENIRKDEKEKVPQIPKAEHPASPQQPLGSLRRPFRGIRAASQRCGSRAGRHRLAA